MDKITEKVEGLIEGMVAKRLDAYSDDPSWSEIVNVTARMIGELLVEIDDVCDISMTEDELVYCIGLVKDAEDEESTDDR